MPAITAAAAHRALSAGALLALSGGFALYQLTSLVLGPAGNRELHFSLTIPAADVDESSMAPAVRANLVLGTLAAPPAASHRSWVLPAARRVATPRPTLPTVIAPAVLVTPVDSPAPATRPSDKPKHSRDD